jgi:SAM-dependent methyltransferase
MTTIEQVRAYWDARPCNIKHGAAPVGTLKWSDQVTRRKYFVEPHIPDFADFNRWRGCRVLEIGCGIGTDTLEFIRAGADISAMDLSKESIKLAEERFMIERRRIPPEANITFYCQDAEEWLPPGPFDLVYSFGVLHHTPNPRRVLINAYKALKPGGELRIMLYSKFSWKKMICQQPEAQANCPLVRTYTKWAVREMLQDLGYEVLSVKKTHIFPWRVKDYICYNYVRAFPWNIIPHQWLESIIGWHLLAVARRPI